MTININKHPGQRILELGGGSARHSASDVNVDVRKVDGVDFECSFENPLPIQTEEFDAVYAHFVLEHVSYPKLPDLLKEMLRVTKPGGKAILAVPDTQAQIQWILGHPEGWDGKNFFVSASEILFGSQDYPDNTHKNFWSPQTAMTLLTEAGWKDVLVQPYGDRKTDLYILATKPGTLIIPSQEPPKPTQETQPLPDIRNVPREVLFSKDYFNGGKKYGGYAREGYRDFPQHEITTRHILARKPESVLELGAARGHIVKRLQDRGIRACGMDISKHCWLTRACEGIIRWDICEFPWPFKNKEFDLIYDIAVLEHIPEEFIPGVAREMERVAHRGLHGIDFGGNDDGFDKTHCSFFPREVWMEKLPTGHEVVNKESLEQGVFPEDVLKGDGKVKLNLGSFQTCFHYGWKNSDQHDLSQYAVQNGYQFEKRDLLQGINQATQSVDMVFLSHVLEHFPYRQGLAILRDIRRVLKPDGVLRVIVPDVEFLASLYEVSLTNPHHLEEFDEINDEAEACPTPAGKFWCLLAGGHSAAYDKQTLCKTLEEAGFVAHPQKFRQSLSPQMLVETLDMQPEISLFVDAVPKLG